MVYSRIILFCCLCIVFLQIANAQEELECKYYSFFTTGGVEQQRAASKEELCGKAVSVLNGLNNGRSYSLTGITGEYTGQCQIKWTDNNNSNSGTGGIPYSSTETKEPCDCPTEGTGTSASFRRNGELFSFPTEVCIDNCSYEFKDPIIGQEVRSDGHITTVFVGTAKSRQLRCPLDTPTDEPEPPLNPCKTKDAQGQPQDKDYCEAPPEGCPAGYVQGIFNGKKVCVKQNQNDNDNCKPTLSDPYKCMPNQPDKPEDPDSEGKCTNGKIQVIIGATLKCVTQETPPDPDGGCPSNYIKQTYNGVSVCVPNNQIPDANDNCPLNTSLTTLSDGTKVCRSGNGHGNGDGNGDGDGTGNGGDGDGDGDGNGDCDPTSDWLCKDFDLPDPEKLTINDVDLPEIDENKISWSQQCPPDETVTLLGKSYAFSYATTCSFLSTYIHPLFVAFGYFSGAMIIIGAVRK